MTKRQKFQQHLQQIANRRLIQPRPYQSRIQEKLNDGWRKNILSQLIVSPTGSGKTVMGLVGCKDFIETIGPELFQCDPSDIGICWVAMRRNLLDQTEEANWELYSDEYEKTLTLCPNIEYVSMFDKNAAERMKKYKYVLMVVDEAQHDAASTMVTLHAQVKPDRVLGLSATPQRSDSLKICFQQQIKDAGYRFLIEDGYLAKFNHWTMQEWNPASVAKLFLKCPDKWGKSLFFFLTHAQCNEFARIVNEAGHPCEIVHGGSNKRAQLEAFDKGAIKLIVSMAVLTEGFDCPSLQSVFVRDARAKSPVIQMAGRVLRRWEDNIKNIIQSTGTHYPFTRLAHANTQFIEESKDKWITIGSNDKVRKRMEYMTKLLVKSNPVLPQYLQKKRDVRWRPNQNA